MHPNAIIGYAPHMTAEYILRTHLTRGNAEAIAAKRRSTAHKQESFHVRRVCLYWAAKGKL